MSDPTQWCDPVQAPPLREAAPAVPAYLSIREILSTPLPHLEKHRVTRWLIRGILMGFRNRFIEIRGLHRLTVDKDPFVLALNHSQRIEAVLLPTLFGYLRQGKLIRFLADWNFLLVPGVAMLFRHGQTVIINRKPAKPRFLNVLRPYLTDKEPGFVRARRVLEEGWSIGVFPEGTTNHDPGKLLRGFQGAAQISIEAGVPVIPAGVRFPRNPPGKPIGEFAPMVLDIGEAMRPPVTGAGAGRKAVLEWHGAIMEEIARLSGKTWQPLSHRKAHVA